MIIIDMDNLITEPFIRDAKCKASKETDLEIGMKTHVSQSNSDFGMEEFIKQIQEAEIQFDKLSRLLINLKALLRDANEESKCVTKALEILEIKKRAEKYIDEAGKIAHDVLGKLQFITIDNLFIRQIPGYQKASVKARMNLTNILTKKFMELMIEFEDIITLEEILEEFVGVKEIEKGLSELYPIYLNTKVLVENQVKSSDNLKNQVDSNQQEGKNQGTSMEERIRFWSRINAIERAKSSEKKSRKCMVMPIILLVVIIIITVLSV